MTREEFFAEVCRRMGWAPTSWRLSVFKDWALHEGMPYDATFNPIATTRQSPAARRNTSYNIGYGPGNWNSVGVGVYADAEAGIAATVETLQLDYYPNIRRCFADQAGYDEAIPELATYVGSESYGRDLVAYMKSLAPTPESTSMNRAEMLIGGYGIRDQDGETLTGEAALAYMDKNQYSLLLGIQNIRRDLADLAATVANANHTGGQQALLDLADRLVKAGHALAGD